MKIKKNDQVKIMSGKDHGKTGSVERVFADKGTVVVTGLNLYKRHTKGRSEEEKGTINQIPRAVSVSNVALVCPKCKEVTRIGFEITEKGKTRVCKKCSQKI